MASEESYRLAEIEYVRASLTLILPILLEQGVLWHRTSVSNLQAILKSGFVQPNRGQFKDTYCQSKVSYGRAIGAISLFDFVSAPENTVLYEAIKWQPFLTDMGAATVLLKIRRDKLKPDKFIQSSDVSELKLTLIPVVECWYKEDIPTGAIEKTVLVRRNSEYDYETFRPDDFASVSSAASRWENMEARQLPDGDLLTAIRKSFE